MPWLQVRLAISPEQAETYEDALLEVGAVSVTFMDAEDQPIFEPELNTTPLWAHTHLLALFEADTNAEMALAHLSLLTGEELPEHSAEVIEDQDWERSWMDNFQPMCFGKRLWIVPSWHAAPQPDAVNLLLDPGLAFGTGTHPTTALCLEWLDGQDLKAATCWISAADRAFWPSPHCCWVPNRPLAPISTCRHWKPLVTMPDATISPPNASRCTCPRICHTSRPTCWSPTFWLARWFPWRRNWLP